jgi:hypothetical protein
MKLDGFPEYGSPRQNAVGTRFARAQLPDGAVIGGKNLWEFQFG